MRRFLHDNALGLVFGLGFLLALGGQAVAGHADFNSQQLSHGGEQISMGAYLTSASFGVDVAENWQSEYLQFLLYVLGTIWLVQRGSPESKKPEDIGTESDADQLVGAHAKPTSPRWARVGGLRTFLYSNSLGLVMGALFLLSWTAQSIAGWATYNADQLSTRQDPTTWLGYLGEADFWNRTLQNWQSELLAVGSFAVIAVYLRQRGSPESKPVGAEHADTADTG